MAEPEGGKVRRRPPERRTIRQVAANVWRESVTDRTMLAAAGLSFFSMFALLPAIAGIGALYALAVDPGTLDRQVSALGQAAPAGLVRIFREFVIEVPRGFGLGVGLLLNLLIIFWTVQRSASGIITALNLVHNIEESRGRMQREGAALAIALGSILFLFVSLFLIAALPILREPLGAGFVDAMMWLRWPLLALLFLVYLEAIYRIAPAEAPRRIAWRSIGALVALAMWLAASGLFSLYLRVVGGFAPYYGSATAPVVLMTWLFIGSWVVMIGAETNEQIVEVRDGAPDHDMKEKVNRA